MRVFLMALLVLLAGCATVRQSDLDAWVGVSVEKLDLHPLFLTVPMTKRYSDSGVEIRNYFNGRETESCTSSTSKRGDIYTSCGTSSVACNNLFFIKDGRVIEYKPVGQCFTDKRVRPAD